MAIITFVPPVQPTESSEKPELKLLKAEFGDGYTQTTRDGLNHIRRVYTLQWEVLTATQAAAIMEFFYDRGGTEPFLYYPADETEPVKVTCEEFSRKKGTPNQVDATFRQCFVLT